MQEEAKGVRAARRRLMVAAFVLATWRPAAADPQMIRIGWSTMPGHMIPVLFTEPDILRHYGTTYTVQPIGFRGSSL